MFKAVILFGFVLMSSISNAETIVVGGKAYEVKPTALEVCGLPQSPEYLAVIFLINAAQGTGEKTYEAACKSGFQTKCTQNDVKKFGIEQVFTLMRKYPSGIKNEGCKSLRDMCEKRCIDSGQFEDRACLIECNQYESWNR